MKTEKQIKKQLQNLRSLYDQADKISFVGFGTCRNISLQIEILEWILK
jgi:hypothetical protein